MRYDITFHGVVSETTAGRLAPPPAKKLEAFVDEVVAIRLTDLLGIPPPW